MARWHCGDPRRGDRNLLVCYALACEMLPQLPAGYDNPPHGLQPELLTSPERCLFLSRVVDVHRLQIVQHEIRPLGIGQILWQGGFELRHRQIEAVEDKDTARRPGLEMLHQLTHRAL